MNLVGEVQDRAGNRSANQCSSSPGEIRTDIPAIVAPTTEDIGAVLTAIDDAMDNGTLSQRKALMQQLVTEIRVESRSAIFPTYRLPAPPVRAISGVVAAADSNHRPPACPGFP